MRAFCDPISYNITRFPITPAQCRVLLNLRTSQPFEEVVEDLGQVLKMTAAKRMYTAGGQEVRSFSQLRNEFADIDTFYLGTSSSVMIPPPILAGGGGGAAMVGGGGGPVVVGSGGASPVRRSRSRAGMSTAMPMPGGEGEGAMGGGGGASAKGPARQRARSKSRPRVLYAPESEIMRQSGAGEWAFVR